MEIGGVDVNVSIDGNRALIVKNPRKDTQNNSFDIIKYSDMKDGWRDPKKEAPDTKHFNNDEYLKVNNALKTLTGTSIRWVSWNSRDFEDFDTDVDEEEDFHDQCEVTFDNLEDILMTYLSMAGNKLNF